MLRTIEQHRPRAFVELGTSSGLSTGLLARMLHDNGGERLVSVDVSDRFYRDETRPTGFLVAEIYDGDRVTVELRSPMTSVDVAGGTTRSRWGSSTATTCTPGLSSTPCACSRG